MSDRKKKKRALESQGFCHASGWIYKKDMHFFDELVKKASNGVAKVSQQLDSKIAMPKLGCKE
jgi:hypothetical protein